MYQKYGGKMEGMQTGGVVNMARASSPSSARFKKAQEEFASKFNGGGQPTIVPMVIPTGGGGEQQKIIANAGTSTAAPNLPDGPSSVQSAEYFYRLSMGSVL